MTDGGIKDNSLTPLPSSPQALERYLNTYDPVFARDQLQQLKNSAPQVLGLLVNQYPKETNFPRQESMAFAIGAMGRAIRNDPHRSVESVELVRTAVNLLMDTYRESTTNAHLITVEPILLGLYNKEDEAIVNSFRDLSRDIYLEMLAREKGQKPLGLYKLHTNPIDNRLFEGILNKLQADNLNDHTILHGLAERNPDDETHIWRRIVYSAKRWTAENPKIP